MDENKYFSRLVDYKLYAIDNGIFDALGLIPEDIDYSLKRSVPITEGVDPDLDYALPAEIDDLVRLHFLLRTRKVTTVLEFGVGKSTVVINLALRQNKYAYGDFVANHLRRSEAFKGYSIDNNERWLRATSESAAIENIELWLSEVRMAEWQGRICTLYDRLPNICPDFIYLDGPDQHTVLGDIRGISTRAGDRLPMAADILAIEHFLLPGCLILVDGRTANVRFLLSNLQRNWIYTYLSEFDQHLIELVEEPLGFINRTQLDFCLGSR